MVGLVVDAAVEAVVARLLCRALSALETLDAADVPDAFEVAEVLEVLAVLKLNALEPLHVPDALLAAVVPLP